MATSKKTQAAAGDETIAVTANEGDTAGNAAVELEQLKAENAQLSAKIDAIMAMLASGTAAAKSGQSTEDAAAIEAITALNKERSEKVTRTYYSRNNNEKDIKVGVNGRLYIIKLGVPVEIPKYVAEIIEHSYNQADEVNSLIVTKTQERAKMDEALA